MSVRIEDILEVISFLKSKYSKSMPEHDFQELRLSAFDHVAVRRGIDRTTIPDKFRQQLQSAIASTGEFDRALREYLTLTRRSAIIFHYTKAPGDATNTANKFAQEESQPCIVSCARLHGNH